MPLLVLLLAAAPCIAAAPQSAPKAVSTDGEATIYLTGNFSRGFNVAYNAVLPKIRTNRSTTFLSLMLLGRHNPGSSIALGITRAAPDQSLEMFVATTTPQGAKNYRAVPAVCLPACTLILRGDRYGLFAFAVTGEAVQKLGSWARADFGFVRPYVQLNAEVTAPGDRIAATLIPMRVIADSQSLATPHCGFSTRGVMPRREPSGALTFAGTYRPQAQASFIDLKAAANVERCSSEPALGSVPSKFRPNNR